MTYQVSSVLLNRTQLNKFCSQLQMWFLFGSKLSSSVDVFD